MSTVALRRPRRRRWGTRLLAVLLTLALLGAAALGVRRLLRDPQPTSAGCPAAPSAAPAPAPASVHLRVLNGTTRRGLAKKVSTDLAARGFVVDEVGNAAAPQTGPTVVLFGAGAQPAAALVAANVLGAAAQPGPPTAAPTAVELVLGAGYDRLRTPEEVAALAATAAPTPTSPTGC